jgi:hypothetical protein
VLIGKIPRLGATFHFGTLAADRDEAS